MSAEQTCPRFAPRRKPLMETVKMSAYRAETARVSVVREKRARGDHARSLRRDLFPTQADLCPE